MAGAVTKKILERLYFADNAVAESNYKLVRKFTATAVIIMYCKRIDSEENTYWLWGVSGFCAL
jgi:hypothetical protein